MSKKELIAIAANIHAIRDLLGQATNIVDEACVYIDEGNSNAVIGTIVGLENILKNAEAIRLAAITLAHMRN